MYLLITIIFVLGYLVIALEHPLRIDKAASAILTGVICWVLLVFGQEAIFGNIQGEHFINESIFHHLGEISGILFFLLGAMTIVELIGVHGGFLLITSRITTLNRVKLLWIICTISFFFSAALDNLTTSIVMAVLLKKLLKKKEDLWFFAGMMIIAANAGGAWSPIGDVTTIMLWIAGKITAINVITHLFLPSLICMLVPLIIASFTMKGSVTRPDQDSENLIAEKNVSNFQQKLILGAGLAALLFVPFFKNFTHLPPFMGILFSLGFLWVFTEVMHRNKHAQIKKVLSVAGVIRRIDTPSILFFLGILLAVASLQTAGHLENLARLMDKTFGDIYTVNILIGFLSAIVDNVPLVAGAIGMYPSSLYPQDHTFWNLLTYCAGTGGSTLIIGSAAGVATMGILKIDFIWYMRKISWLAILGYLSGVLVYYLMML